MGAPSSSCTVHLFWHWNVLIALAAARGRSCNCINFARINILTSYILISHPWCWPGNYVRPRAWTDNLSPVMKLMILASLVPRVSRVSRVPTLRVETLRHETPVPVESGAWPGARCHNQVWSGRRTWLLNLLSSNRFRSLLTFRPYPTTISFTFTALTKDIISGWIQADEDKKTHFSTSKYLLKIVSMGREFSDWRG